MAVTIQNSGNALSYPPPPRISLKHATWGPTPDSIAHLQTIGINAWLGEQFSAAPPPTICPSTPLPISPPSRNNSSKMPSADHDQLRQRVAFASGQITVVSGD